MSELDITSNRNTSKYTRKELFLRVLWGLGKCVFRLSPRPCFGIRRWILRSFGASVGSNVNIYPSTLIYYPWNLEIGADSSIGEWALIYNLGKISIGERATISQRVHLCGGTHDYKDTEMPLVKSEICIGDEVWVCADAFIGPAVDLGPRVIVAAASVVIKDVEEGLIVGGNPACVIKSRSE